jgi:peptidyl-prolyl cis-trans isomerase SurA
MLARALLLSALCFAASRAEIIDRIAVALDNQAITESEIMREIRLTAFQNGVPPDFSPQARRKAADRLIEQKLIGKEIELGRYVKQDPTATDPMLKQIQAQRYRSPAEYQQALEKYGITEEDLRAHLLLQLTLLRFIDLRFRPGIQVNESDIKQYFDQKLPELEKTAGAGKKITFDDLRGKIQDALTDQLVDQQLNEWIAETRKHTRIQFHPEAFQ